MRRKDSSRQKRKRGKDKKREHYEINGKYSSKHLRARERDQKVKLEKTTANM